MMPDRGHVSTAGGRTPVALADLVIGEPSRIVVPVAMAFDSWSLMHSVTTTCGCARLVSEPAFDASSDSVLCILEAVAGPFDEDFMPDLLFHSGSGEPIRVPLRARTIPPVPGWPEEARSRNLSGVVQIPLHPAYGDRVRAVQCFKESGVQIPAAYNQSTGYIEIDPGEDMSVLTLVLTFESSDGKGLRWSGRIRSG